MKSFKNLMLTELGKDVRYKAGTELTVNKGGEDIRVTVIMHQKGADKVTVKTSDGKELIVATSQIKESEESDEDEDLEHLFEANVLTKKHFVVIAGMLKNAKTLDQLKDMLFSWVKTSNPNFDVDRFKKAAGMTESVDLDEGTVELSGINTNADTVTIKVSDFDGNSTKFLGLNDNESVSSFKKFLDKRMKWTKKK